MLPCTTLYISFPGMVFNISVGFSDLEDSKKKYALFVGDTVVVSQGGPCTILTPLKKRVKHIGIFLKGDSDSESEGEAEQPSQELLGRGARRGVVQEARTRVSKWVWFN